jgi:hypothetical protein
MPRKTTTTPGPKESVKKTEVDFENCLHQAEQASAYNLWSRLKAVAKLTTTLFVILAGLAGAIATCFVSANYFGFILACAFAANGCVIMAWRAVLDPNNLWGSSFFSGGKIALKYVFDGCVPSSIEDTRDRMKNIGITFFIFAGVFTVTNIVLLVGLTQCCGCATGCFICGR